MSNNGKWVRFNFHGEVGDPIWSMWIDGQRFHFPGKMIPKYRWARIKQLVRWFVRHPIRFFRNREWRINEMWFEYWIREPAENPKP